MTQGDINRRTFIAGCTVGAASVMVGTASAAAEQVEATVTSRGERVTRFEDFSTPSQYDKSSLAQVNSGTLEYPQRYILDGYDSDVSDDGFYQYSGSYNSVSPQEIATYYGNTQKDGSFASGDTLPQGMSGVWEFTDSTLTVEGWSSAPMDTSNDLVIYHNGSLELASDLSLLNGGTGSITLVNDGQISATTANWLQNNGTPDSFIVCPSFVTGGANFDRTFKINATVYTGSYTPGDIASNDPLLINGALLNPNTTVDLSGNGTAEAPNFVTYDSGIRNTVPLELKRDYWVDFYETNRSESYDVSVPESISSELRITETVPDGTETTVSPGEKVTISTNSFYVRWDLAPGETIPAYSVEIDERTAIDTVTIAGQSNTINRVLAPGETVSFTTSVALGTGYDIDITPISTGDNTTVDVELRGTKIRAAGGAVVLENGNPQPRGSLYYAPNGESILWIPEVDANNWKFELIEETTNVTTDDLDLSGYVTDQELNLSEYVKESDLNQDPDVSAEDVEGLDEYIERKGTPQGGGIPPSDSGPIEQITGFFRGIGRSISQSVSDFRRQLS